MSAVATEGRFADVPVAGRTVATHYHDEGTGPVVLLIHGSGPGVSAQANWAGVIPRFADRFRVIAPDLAGFARSTLPEDTAIGVEGWTEQIIGLLDELGIDRCSIVGNSFGGALSLRVALQEPARVDRQVLMGPVGATFPLTDALDAAWGYASRTPEAMRELLYDFSAKPESITDALVESRHSAAVAPGILEAYTAMFPAPRQQWIEALALSDDELRRVSQETLITHGREDQVIPVSVSYHLHEVIEHSQLHVFGTCGHWVMIDQAERFARLVCDFLDEARA
jgi:2-hydroxymuconate-semialdehyde hydrolase